MNDYETRRQEKIKANQALLAELDIKPVVPKAKRAADSKPPSAKRRKVGTESAPSRTSARIASAPTRPLYRDEPDVKAVPLPRSVIGSRKKTSASGARGSQRGGENEPLVPVKDVDAIQAGWTAWAPTGPEPTRDDASKAFHFDDYPDFSPNKSPAEMLREGCFGGSYYRPLKSRRLGIVVRNDWEELPAAWIQDLDVSRFLTAPVYDPDVNKYKVSCGQSIEEWEAAGWISHEHDVRGWFQWYTRFFRGRRCDDDARQIRRWKNCVGETGRWRRMLLKKYVQMGVREVFDDGAEEEEREVSPVMHQTCHHWAFEVRQGHLDEMWRSVGGSTLHALYADPSTNDLGDSICGLSRGEVLEARADRRGLYRTAAETQLKDVLLELGGLRNFPAANHADRAAEVKRIADAVDIAGVQSVL